MVTLSQRIKQRISLFFQPARESIQEQITAVTGKKPDPRFVSPPTIAREGFISDPSVQQEIIKRQRRISGESTAQFNARVQDQLKSQARAEAERQRILTEQQKARREIEIIEKERRRQILNLARERNRQINQAQTFSQKRNIAQIKENEMREVNKEARILKNNIAESERIRQKRKKLGLKETKPIPKDSAVISKLEDMNFIDIEPRLRIKIEKFIRDKIPGGRTIIRKLKDGLATLKDIEKRFPVVEDFLSASEKRRRKMLSKGFVVETKDLFPGIPKGTKTDIGDFFRTATFEERLGVKKDKDTSKLKLQVKIIQSNLVLEKITEKEADARLDTVLGEFMTKKAKQRIPQNIALGLAFTAIQGIPIVGQAVTAGFVGTAILNRRTIASQFKNFPKASAIDTASFMVGGLVGSVIKGSVKGRFNKNIDPKQLKSVSYITGNEKIKAINQAKQLDSGLRVAIKQKKITGLSVYDILMKDNRLYRVIEFNKLSPRDLAKGLQGEKGLIGFQLLKARGETFFGRGVSVVVDGKSQTFLRILRFKQAKSPIGRAIQKFGFNKGKIIDVLEKSKVVIKKGKVTGILSKAKIKSIKNINVRLGRLINKLEKKIKAGKKIGIADFKKLINLERRANELKPFTKAEFKSARFPTITQTLILKVLKNAKIVFQKNTNLISASAKIKVGVIGISRTAPGKIKVGVKKAKIKKTPLSVTFKEPSKFQTQLQSLVRKTKGATNQQLRKISKQVEAMKIKLRTSPGSVTLALAVDLDKSIKISVIPGAVVGITVRSIWEGVGNVLSNPDFVFYSTIKKGRLTSEQRWIVSQLPKIGLKIKTKLKVLQKIKQKIKQKLKPKQRTELMIKQKQITGQIQGLKQLQKVGQKLKQKQKIITRGRGGGPGITKPLIPPEKIKLLIPIRLLKGFKKKKLRKGQQTFFVKIKRRGKIINLTPRPLLLKDAKNYLAYELDHSLIRSGWFEPMGKSKVVVVVPKKMNGYFNKIRKKLRGFKIKAGKKKKIRNGYIEKKKYVGDTRGEIKQLQASRKGRRRKSKKKKRRNIRKGNQKRNSKRRKPTRRKSVKKRRIRKRVVRRRSVKKRVIRRRKFKSRKKIVIRKGNQKRNSKKKGRRNPIRRRIVVKRKPKIKKRSKKRITRRRNHKIKSKKRNSKRRRPVKKRKIVGRKSRRRIIKRRKPIKKKRRVKRKVVRRKKVRRPKKKSTKKKTKKRKNIKRRKR